MKKNTIKEFTAIQVDYKGVQIDKNTFRRVFALLDTCINDDVVTLYSYNATTNAWLACKLNCKLRNVKDCAMFARIIARAWYEHQKATIDTKAKALADRIDKEFNAAPTPEEYTPDEQTMILKARLREAGKDFDKCINYFADAPKAEGFARIVAISRIGGNVDMYGGDIKSACGRIVELCKIDEVESTNKDLREAVTALTLLLSTAESDMYYPFTFKANARLTRAVFQSVRTVARYDKAGNVKDGKYSAKNVVTSCVLACVEELQIRAAQKEGAAA